MNLRRGTIIELNLLHVRSLNTFLYLFLQGGSTDVLPVTSASPSEATGAEGESGSADMRVLSTSHKRDEKSAGADSATLSEANHVKPPTLSLDALAKAKRALQMQKELAEKMKKLPQVTRNVALSITVSLFAHIYVQDLYGSSFFISFSLGAPSAFR